MIRNKRDCGSLSKSNLPFILIWQFIFYLFQKRDHLRISQKHAHIRIDRDRIVACLRSCDEIVLGKGCDEILQRLSFNGLRVRLASRPR